MFAVGRLVGFAMFGGLAMLIIAGVVLLPAYADYKQACYERDRNAAEIADMSARAATRDRQIAEMPNDRVYTMRLMSSHEGLMPAGEVVQMDPYAAAATPTTETIRIRPHNRPEPPGGMLLRIANRLENASLRRGLCLLAALCLIAAFFCFAPPQKYARTTRGNTSKV